MLAVAANAVFAIAKLLAPVEEIFPRACGLNADFFELMRGEGEESFPGGDLGRVSGEAATDGGEETGMVGNEGSRLRSRSDGNRVLQVADAGLGQRCGGRCRVEKGSSEDHRGGC